MANVGSGNDGETLIGTGNGSSPTFAPIGKNSGLNLQGVVVAQDNNAFTATNAGSSGQVLTSNGGTDPSFQDVSASGAITTITGNDSVAENPIAGNFNLVTANATAQFLGTTGEETLDFGLSNLLLGSNPLSITSANNNAGFGLNSLSNLSSGTDNACFGYSSGHLNSTGSFNTAIGYQALTSNTIGSGNVAIGFNSMQNFTGSGNARNIAIGYTALSAAFTGLQNIAIGINAGTNFTGSESSNILIGSNVGTLGDANTIRIGNPGIGDGTQNTCYIAGIAGVVTSNTNIVTVDITSGLMGSVASVPVTLGGTGLTSLGNSHVLASNSTGTVAARSFQVKNQVFTTSGTYTRTTGALYCSVQALGGGGAGGGAPATGAGQTSTGGGGGSGQYAVAVFSAATIGASQTVTIGAGGTGNSGATGNNGGNTSLGALITANGGSGGTSSGAGTSATANGGGGGSGGTGGDYSTPGTLGNAGIAVVAALITYSGQGASSQLGSGGQPNLFGSSGGSAGQGHGSGGSGGLNQASQSANTGGAGAGGIIIVTEYIIN